MLTNHSEANLSGEASAATLNYVSSRDYLGDKDSSFNENDIDRLYNDMVGNNKPLGDTPPTK